MSSTGGSFTPISSPRYAWRTTLFTLREYALFAIIVVLILNIIGSLSTVLFPNRPHVTEVLRRFMSYVFGPHTKKEEEDVGHHKRD